jgi:hypothetical protein
MTGASKRGPMANVDGDDTEADQKLGIVARSIVQEFVDELSKVDGFADVAERLRETIIDQKKMSETAIQAAIFPDPL